MLVHVNVHAQFDVLYRSSNINMAHIASRLLVPEVVYCMVGYRLWVQKWLPGSKMTSEALFMATVTHNSMKRNSWKFSFMSEKVK